MNTNLTSEEGLYGPQSEMAPADQLLLTIAGPTHEDDVNLAVAVKNLSTTGIILEADAGDGGPVAETVKGRDAILQLPASLKCDMAYIKGTLLWSREDRGAYTLGLDLREPLPTGVRRTLESQMEIANKDIKELWDQWDQIHGRRHLGGAEVRTAPPAPIFSPVEAGESPVADDGAGTSRGTYWVGFGVMAAGAVMQFVGPDYLKFSGLVLIIYGSALVAVKSIWGMWQGRRSQMS